MRNLKERLIGLGFVTKVYEEQNNLETLIREFKCGIPWGEYLGQPCRVEYIEGQNIFQVCIDIDADWYFQYDVFPVESSEEIIEEILGKMERPCLSCDNNIYWCRS